MSSCSDYDMSESSNSSPQMYIKESPVRSPPQQVPQLTSYLTALTCTDPNLNYYRQSTEPFLRIEEQPQDQFRFRYVSEMVGTHGCLLGKSSASSKNKSHPTVELVNFSGQAIIKCSLAQHNNEDDHPHKLLVDDKDEDVYYQVPEHGSYKVGFGGMGIIHTAKKDVSKLLFKKISAQNKNSNANAIKNLRAYCDHMAKEINLNMVRLKFSAYDIQMKAEICKPVFSEPIYNMKSAATNGLKICRISKNTGRPSGSEDVFLLVEKVNKKDIAIRFYELNENGEEVWSSNGTFMHTDVHHQYAIVFRTPAYTNPKTPVDVNVFIELVRPSDGRTSTPQPFTYKAEDVYRIRRRQNGSSHSSIGSSGGSIRSDNGIPVALLNNFNEDAVEFVDDAAVPFAVPRVGVSGPSQVVDLGNALLQTNVTSPMLAQGQLPPAPVNSLPDLKLDSADFKHNSAEIRAHLQNVADMDISEIDELFESQLADEYIECFQSFDPNRMDFIRSMQVVADSGRGAGKRVPLKPERHETGTSTAAVDKKQKMDYPAYYTVDDGNEVKSLVQELCGIIRNKNGYKKQDVRNKLERLFELRLSNGDTFLHMTLCSNEPSLQYIVKIVHSVRMTHLLDYGNDRRQTVLHLAVARDLPHMVAQLVAIGCNPMAKDLEEQNAVHYAVKYQSCLDVLMDSINKHKVSCDLNACNSEKQTALHLAVIVNDERAARTLLRCGAGYSVRDAEGRTPLHLAAYDDRPLVARALLDVMPPSDVDVTDGRGNTALQIVCGGSSLRTNTIEIAKLLLAKKSDPHKHEDHNESAWHLARDKPALRDLLQRHAITAATTELDVKYEPLDDADVKSEPEDEYESADEELEESEGLQDLGLYSRELAARLDASGAWRRVAERLSFDSLLGWYAAQPSPTSTLLNHLKESRNDITSKSLALILEDIGETDAAKIVRRYIN